MAKAVLMKLKADVTKDELKQLEDLLLRLGDPTWTQPSRFRPEPTAIREYDDQYGDPVFYIP